MATKPDTSPADIPTSEQPVEIFRYGPLSAALYPVEITLPAGKKFTKYNVSLRKAYRNSHGEWDHTRTLGGDDALGAAFLYTRCAQYIADARKGQTEE